MQDQLYLQHGLDNVLEALAAIKDALDGNYEMVSDIYIYTIYNTSILFQIQYVSRHGSFLHRIIECCSSTEEKIVLIALKVCSTIAFGDDGEVMALLKCNFLTCLKVSFSYGSSEVKAQILFALSNLCASKSKEIIKKVMEENGILDMIACNSYNHSIAIRKEAVFCAINLVSGMAGVEFHTLLQEFVAQVFLDTIGGFGNRELESLMLRVVHAVMQFVC